MVTFSLKNILRSPNTVFTFKDILLASAESNPLLLKRRLSYYVTKGDLYPIRRGLYAKDKDYNRLELATKIFTPSYVSFETVLGPAGITFQHYTQIAIASYQTKTIVVDGQLYSFKKIKDPILTNKAGIENKGNCSIATPERALLDVLYLNKDYHFDNLGPINWDEAFELLLIYSNKRMEKKIKQFFEHHNETK